MKRGQGSRLRPSRYALVDAGLLLLLAGLALLGFHNTFTGTTYLLVGVAGLLLGILLGHVANALDQPVVRLAVFTVAAFFLLGGAVALHGGGSESMVPLPATVSELADQGVHGWKDLLTTLPPVDGSGPLLVLPYLLGLVTGAGGAALSSRTDAAAAPVVAPVLLLAVVILLGVQQPTSVLLQSALFAAGALSWTTLRARRRRPVAQSGSGRATRAVTAVLLTAIASAGAVVVGPALPGADHQRVVLRSFVTPPFDVGRYPSPLASFRAYTRHHRDPDLYDKVLLTVSGVPAGTRIRFATLDNYDGTVWGAADEAPGADSVSDTFQRVGSTIANPARGRPVSGEVTVAAGYSGVWLPTVGSLTRLEFTGAAAQGEQEGFRYNLATGTGVLPEGVRAGDSYRFRAVLPDDKLTASAHPYPETLPAADAAGFLQTQAGEWSGRAGTPMQRVLAVATFLHDKGRYSDGGTGQVQYTSGHYVKRLLSFANGDQIVGDDEQYAATFALLANRLGVPARVVMGAVLPRGGAVRGRDVHAWVEVRVDDGSWRTIPTSRFMDRNQPPDQQPPVQQETTSGTVVPPPSPVRPPSSVGDPNAVDLQARGRSHDHASPSFHLPGVLVALLLWAGIPLLALGVLAAAVVALKAHRRRLRRRHGAPAARFAGGWRDLMDHARDLGHVVPARRTRREQASVLAIPGLHPLAMAADAHVFGPGDPTDADAGAYWAEADQVRRQMSRGVGRLRRWRAAVALTSFRKSRTVAPGGPR